MTHLQRDPTGEVPLLTFSEAQDIAGVRWVSAPQAGSEVAPGCLYLYLLNMSVLSAGGLLCQRGSWGRFIA